MCVWLSVTCTTAHVHVPVCEAACSKSFYSDIGKLSTHHSSNALPCQMPRDAAKGIMRDIVACTARLHSSCLGSDGGNLRRFSERNLSPTCPEL